MKLWVLKPVENWIPWYDKAFGFVIRAETETEARAIAHHNGGFENDADGNPWLDDRKTTCTELQIEGESEMIIRAFWSA